MFVAVGMFLWSSHTEPQFFFVLSVYRVSSLLQQKNDNNRRESKDGITQKQPPY